MTEYFRKFAHKASVAAGSPVAFFISLLIVVVWALLGPTFHYSDTWQLIINTGTTVVTFLMVFIIQNSQNRDGRALHLKLDELLRANSHARNHLIDLQSLSDSELDKVHEELCEASHQTEERIQQVRKHKSKRGV